MYLAEETLGRRNRVSARVGWVGPLMGNRCNCAGDTATGRARPAWSGPASQNREPVWDKKCTGSVGMGHFCGGIVLFEARKSDDR